MKRKESRSQEKEGASRLDDPAQTEVGNVSRPLESEVGRALDPRRRLRDFLASSTSDADNVLPRETGLVAHAPEDRVVLVEEDERLVKLHDDSLVHDEDTVVEGLDICTARRQQGDARWEEGRRA